MERLLLVSGAVTGDAHECAQIVYAQFEKIENFEKLEQQINVFSNIFLFITYQKL